jgi:hypothetical protein
MKNTKYSFNPDLTYGDVAHLALEHGCNSLATLGKEFYNRTRFGVSTRFNTVNNSFNYQDNDPGVTAVLAPNGATVKNVVSITFSTIVEGACFVANPLIFPFTDQDLAGTWEFLDELVNDHFTEKTQTGN